MNIIKESRRDISFDQGTLVDVEVVDGKLQLRWLREVDVYREETAIPNMTSATEPSGIVTYSTPSAGNFGWHVFNSGNNYFTSSSSNAPTAWVSYEFPSEKRIYKYAVTSQNNTSGNLRSWFFEGTDNDVDWILLDEVSDQPNWVAGERRVFNIPNEHFYKKYRLRSANSPNFAIRYLEMMELAIEQAYKLSGTFESNVIDLGNYLQEIKSISSIRNVPDDSSVKIYISTSSNRIEFSPYEEINYGTGEINSPEARYLKVKIELSGKADEREVAINSFSKEEASQFQSNDFIEFNDGLGLKTSYEQTMSRDVNWVDEGVLYRNLITKDDWKMIDSIFNKINF